MSVRSAVPAASSGVGGGAENMFSLKWNHYHSFLTGGLAKLLDDDFSMTDVTLACEGQFIQAHKVALAVCSPFFKEYFKTYRMEKSGGLIVLANVRFRDLKNLIRFIYYGEVNIGNSELNSFLKTANDLKIEGLVDAQDAGAVAPTTKNEQKVVNSNPPSVPTIQSAAASRLPVSTSSHSTSSNSDPPPIKRSRISNTFAQSISTPTTTSVQAPIIPSASSSSASSMSMHKPLDPSIPISIVPKQNTASSVQLSHMTNYDDPLEMEDEQEEEMISLDVKPEPIAVYTLNDEDDDEDSMDHHGGDSLSDTLGNESSGLVYHDYESTLSQQSGPGPSAASLQSHHRIQTPGSAPRPTNKPPVAEKESLEGSGGGSVSFHELIDTFLMKCKKCGDSVTTDQFQTHGCVNSPTGTIEPVMCPHCGKAFKNKNSLKVHKSTYHRKTSTKISSGTRLTSLVDLEFTTTTGTVSSPIPSEQNIPPPPPPAMQQQPPPAPSFEDITNPANFLQVKLEPVSLTNPYSKAKESQRRPLFPGEISSATITTPQSLPLISSSAIVRKPIALQSQQQDQISPMNSQMPNLLSNLPMFFGDLEAPEMDSLQLLEDKKPNLPKTD